MAYVVGGTMSGWRQVNNQWVQYSDNFSYTYVRLCKLLLDEEDIKSVALVMYHELIHMVSTVGDQGGVYGKLGAHQLAQV